MWSKWGWYSSAISILAMLFITILMMTDKMDVFFNHPVYRIVGILLYALIFTTLFIPIKVVKAEDNTPHEK